MQLGIILGIGAGTWFVAGQTGHWCGTKFVCIQHSRQDAAQQQQQQQQVQSMANSLSKTTA
jgi:hypothetical protein